MLTLDISKIAPFVSTETINAYADRVAAAQKALEDGTCPGNDYIGWLHLPSSITPDFLADIKATAAILRSVPSSKPSATASNGSSTMARIPSSSLQATTSAKTISPS